MDGIPIELFLALRDILGPIWFNTTNCAIDQGHFHEDFNTNTALITVILKPGKAPLECSNYWTNALIPADMKLLQF